VYEERKNESAPWNSTAKLIRKIAFKNAQSRWQGEGCDDKKATHNSVVEASLYRNESFVPEIRIEFRAQAGERVRIESRKLANN
jgi:hypothetical protein